jgi:hypothetical protein
MMRSFLLHAALLAAPGCVAAAGSSFLSLPVYDVHSPIMAKPELVAKYEVKAARRNCRMTATTAAAHGGRMIRSARCWRLFGSALFDYWPGAARPRATH